MKLSEDNFQCFSDSVILQKVFMLGFHSKQYKNLIDMFSHYNQRRLGIYLLKLSFHKFQRKLVLKFLNGYIKCELLVKLLSHFKPLIFRNNHVSQFAGIHLIDGSLWSFDLLSSFLCLPRKQLESKVGESEKGALHQVPQPVDGNCNWYYLETKSCNQHFVQPNYVNALGH